MLCFSATQLLWNCNKDRMERIMKLAFHGGRQPALWKQASAVVIHKAGTGNYILWKAPRLILLLTCMWKLLETVIAKLLSEKPKKDLHYSTLDLSETDKDGQSSMMWLSWSTELMQSGTIVIYLPSFSWTSKQPSNVWRISAKIHFRQGGMAGSVLRCCKGIRPCMAS